jgi:hypothetical protein
MAAQRGPSGALAAQVAVRRARDRVAVLEDALGEAFEPCREVGGLVLRVGRRDRLVGALEQQVGDFDSRRAVAQGGERVDDPLRVVLALDQ